jgi:endonuclease YncB( thermonuclease family)
MSHTDCVNATRLIGHSLAGAAYVGVFALGLCRAAIAESFDARVVSVSDGDTVTVLRSDHRRYKVRISGIDAPEKGQSFGARAKQAMADCAFGQTAHLEGEKIDRYGRLVAKVSVKGTDCGLMQIKRGLAWHYKRYAKDQPLEDRLSYANAEEIARKARAGLWSEPDPVPPWGYRRTKHQRHK